MWQNNAGSSKRVYVARQCKYGREDTLCRDSTGAAVPSSPWTCSSLTVYFMCGCCPCRQYIQPVPAAKKRSFLPILLLLTDLAWIATYLVSMGLNDWSFQNLKLNPMAGSSAEALTTLGAVDYDKVVNSHQWWRIIAAPFLCSGQCPVATECVFIYVYSGCDRHTYV